MVKSACACIYYLVLTESLVKKLTRLKDGYYQMRF